jgi:hypothetical protein
MNAMLARLFLLSGFCLILGCTDSPPTTPETRTVQLPNAGNTAIYDVDPDDPYEVGDNEFLTLQPGQYTNRYGTRLITPFAGDPVRYHIIGSRDDTLGYLRAPSGRIQSIHITSPNVVTQNGLRIGMQRGEVRQRQHTIDETEFRFSGPAGDSARIVELILR